MFRTRGAQVWLNRVGAIVALTILVFAGAMQAQAQLSVTTERSSAIHAGEFVVPINKSQILRVDQPFRELLVGNPELADVLALTDRSIYVLGKEIGSTNLTIYGSNRRLLAVIDLVVSFDVEGLKAKLYEVMPNEIFEVRTVNGAVHVSGQVSNAGKVDQALQIAERFAPKSVTNALSVSGSEQVLLEVRFVELSRSGGRALGIGLDAANDSGSFDFSSGSAAGAASFALGAPFATTIIGFALGALDIDLTIDALEDKNLAKRLAEPNLVALSGDTASFLAGGEFPVPVNQGDGEVTVEFKEFGVGLSFTPTVIGDDLINLIVAPEVSQIDSTLSVTISTGADSSVVVVPGLSTRRARTTVELRDGQSFAIGGLLQSDYQNFVSQLPWLADVPVLGTLFRSSEFQRSETELVIIVTVHLVQPAPSLNAIATPIDTFVAPNDLELFLLGELQRVDKNEYFRTLGDLPPPDQSSAIQQPTAKQIVGTQGGGLTGSYGHIVK